MFNISSWRVVTEHDLQTLCSIFAAGEFVTKHDLQTLCSILAAGEWGSQTIVKHYGLRDSRILG